MLADYSNVIIFLLLGIANVIGVVLIPRLLLRPSNPKEEKLKPYECGEEPVGQGWVQYNLRFFIVALIFIVFDVEIVFLFPWAVVFRELSQSMGILVFMDLVLFLGILAIGLAYLWKKGLLDWIRTVKEVHS